MPVTQSYQAVTYRTRISGEFNMPFEWANCRDTTIRRFVEWHSNTGGFRVYT